MRMFYDGIATTVLIWLYPGNLRLVVRNCFRSASFEGCRMSHRSAQASACFCASGSHVIASILFDHLARRKVLWILTISCWTSGRFVAKRIGSLAASAKTAKIWPINLKGTLINIHCSGDLVLGCSPVNIINSKPTSSFHYFKLRLLYWNLSFSLTANNFQEFRFLNSQGRAKNESYAIRYIEPPAAAL